MKLDPEKCPVCGRDMIDEVEGYELEEGEVASYGHCPSYCYRYRLTNRWSSSIKVGEAEWRWRDNIPDNDLKEIREEVERLCKIPTNPVTLSFYKALIANPYDNHTRQVYADYLEEHGMDDEALTLRGWTEDKQWAEDRIVQMAVECEITPQELLDAAENYLETGEWFRIGTENPDWTYGSMDEFWGHFETLTGKSRTSKEDGDDYSKQFIRCAC